MDHGIYTYAQLRTQFSRRALQKKINEKELRRIVRGWYAEPSADSRLVTGIRNSARVGCLTGCKLHSLWVPPQSGYHYVGGPGGNRPRGYHLSPRPLPASPVWDLAECIDHVVKNHGLEEALIVIESALNLKKCTRTSMVNLLNDRGVKGARILNHLDHAESGSETRVRLFLQSRRIPVTSQAHIPGIGRVDLLVGRRLILECDSGAYHSPYDRYLLDRRRDVTARMLGYDVLRLSYEQIWTTWAETQHILSALVRQRRHHYEPRPLCAGGFSRSGTDISSR